MAKKIHTASVKVTSPINSTVKVQTGRISAPVTDLSPIGYATIKEVAPTNGNFKSFIETLFASSTKAVIAFIKGKNDTVLSTDSIDAITLGKGVIDTAHPVDVLNRSVQYIRSYADTYTAEDTPYINAGKAFSDSINNSDNETISFNKGLSELILHTDRASITSTKGNSEVATVTEHKLYAFSKNLQDESLIDTLLAISISKSFADTAEAFDELSLSDGSVWQVTKRFANIINTSDALQIITSFNRLFNDNPTTAEDLSFSFSKVLEDEALAIELIRIAMDRTRSFADVYSGITDQYSGHLNKRRKDTVSSKDKITSKSFGKARNEVLTPSTRIFLYPNLGKNEIVSINIEAVYNLTKVFNNRVVPRENTFKALLKARADIVTPIENSIFTVRKSLSETSEVIEVIGKHTTKGLFVDQSQAVEGPGIIDEELYASNYFLDDYTFNFVPTVDTIKVLTDSVTTPDLIGISDGSLYTFIKSSFDSVSVPDIFARTVTFIRYYDDSVSESEFVAKTFTKPFVEDRTAQDGPSIDLYWVNDYSTNSYSYESRPVWELTKPLTDLAYGNTTTIRDFIKSRTDTAVILDDDVYTLTKPFSDIEQYGFDGPGFLRYWEEDYAYVLYSYETYVLKDFTKGLNDNLVQSETRAIELTRGTYNDDALPVSQLYLDFTRPLSSAIGNSDAITSINVNKSFADSVSLEDICNAENGGIFKTEEFAALDVYSPIFTKSVFETLIASEDITTFDINKPFTETFDAFYFEGPGGVIADDYAADYFDPLYLLERRPLKDFVKGTIVETLTVPDFYAPTFDKPRSDSITVSDDVTSFNYIKALSDLVQSIDLINIEDGLNFIYYKSTNEVINVPDFYISTFDKPRSDSSVVLEKYISLFTKSVVDSITVLEDIASFSINKPLTEVFDAFYFEGPGVVIADDYVVDYFEPTYLSERRPLKYFEKGTIADTLTTPLTYNLEVVKGNFAQTVTAPDAYISTLNKPLVDSVTAVEDITSFDYTKALADTTQAIDLLNIADGLNFAYYKSTAETLVASEFYISTFDKPRSDSVTIPDDDVYSLTKPLTEVIESFYFEGPALYNSDSYSELYFELGYIVDSGPIRSFTKPRSDSVTVPFTRNNEFTKGNIYLDQPVNDADVYAFTKVVADSITSLDDITSFDIDKVLADIATPQDLLNIADGLNYAYYKATSDLANVSDQYVSNFAPSKTDSVTVSEDISTFDIIKPLTEVFGAFYFEGPGIVIADDYAVDYFNEFYLAERRPLKDVTKVLVDSQSQIDDTIWTIQKPFVDSTIQLDNVDLLFTKATSDTQSVSDSDVWSFTKALNDSITSLDDVTSFDVTKVLADAVSPDDTIGVPDGSTFSYDKNINNFLNNVTDDFSRTMTYYRMYSDTVENISDATSLDITKSFSDSVTMNDEAATELKTENLYPPGQVAAAEDDGLILMTDYIDITYFQQSFTGTERSFS